METPGTWSTTTPGAVLGQSFIHAQGSHAEWFRQGLGGQLLEKPKAPAGENGTEGKGVRRSRLGGLLSFYHREAARASVMICWTPQV